MDTSEHDASILDALQSLESIHDTMPEDQQIECWEDFWGVALAILRKRHMYSHLNNLIPENAGLLLEVARLKKEIEAAMATIEEAADVNVRLAARPDTTNLEKRCSELAEALSLNIELIDKMELGNVAYETEISTLKSKLDSDKNAKHIAKLTENSLSATRHIAELNRRLHFKQEEILKLRSQLEDTTDAVTLEDKFRASCVEISDLKRQLTQFKQLED